MTATVAETVSGPVTVAVAGSVFVPGSLAVAVAEPGFGSPGR